MSSFSFPTKKKFIPIIFISIIYICLAIFFWSCAPKEKVPDPVDQVIGSMSDTLPKISIPEDADPESEDWKGVDLEPKNPVLPLYPEEEAKLFQLPNGYHIEPILTEPKIEQPGAIAFDGNGRMYVLELRTYMKTADSDGTLEPVSRISRWEDDDNDGIYEKGGVFVDSLIFPRFVLPYGKDCVLTMESDADNVYKYTDTNGDGKADKKEFFTNKYGRSGNVEHQQAFMYYGMDNWLYSTVNAFRVRETSSGIIREKTGFNGAQWGVTQDDDGKLWFQGGASGVPSYFEFPIHYGNFEVENNLAEGFEVPWGAAVKIADLQEGMDRVSEKTGGPTRVTGSAGNDIFRGDRLPKEVYGQYFYGEPVARIVRQINPVVSEGLTTLHNVFQNQQSEFLKSTDPLFRPVDMATAPDGTLYVVDMYHGIIQEGQWAQKGTYLRAKIEQYQLDKVIGLGRIWRISHEGMERDKAKPRMLEETTAQLVKHLEHPNGWWRDEAQKLIVLAQDKSIAPRLKAMLEKNKNILARFHALWCLEGLGSLTPELLQDLFKDPNPRMRVQAIRASETLYKAGSRSFADNYSLLMKDENTEVALQAILTANILEVPGFQDQLKQLMKENKVKGIQVVGAQILNPKQEESWWNRDDVKLTDAQKTTIEKGAVIFNELCVQCHGSDGMGTPLGNGAIMAPPLAGSVRVQGHPDYVIKTVMRGLEGLLDGKSYPAGIMVANGEQSDEWIAAITSYIRTNLSNEAGLVTKEEVGKIRLKTQDKKVPYKYMELINSVPQILAPSENWKVTASHTVPTRIGGTASPRSAFNYEGWSTGESQKKGMWFQIEFPEPTTVSELHFNSPPKRRGNWRDQIPPFETYPRAYDVQVSLDGKNWESVAMGGGENANMVIAFDPVKAKFLRITQTGSLKGEDEIPWSMRQMKIYGILN